MNAPQTLTELRDLVINAPEDQLERREYAEQNGLPTHDHDGLDMTSLPTFGGEEPIDTMGIWSWDENNLLVGDGSDLEIVSRDEWG